MDIISDAVLLKKAGKNFIGLCPFHSEKTPSFTVSPDKQIFYCFGCGTGGNVFSFLMKQEGLSFPETARRLAKRYGINLPIGRFHRIKKRNQRKGKPARYQPAGHGFFPQNIVPRNRQDNRRGHILVRRGISQKTIDDFKLGYAPDGWDHLLNYFATQRISAHFDRKKRPDSSQEK